MRVHAMTLVALLSSSGCERANAGARRAPIVSPTPPAPAASPAAPAPERFTLLDDLRAGRVGWADVLSADGLIVESSDDEGRGPVPHRRSMLCGPDAVRFLEALGSELPKILATSEGDRSVCGIEGDKARCWITGTLPPPPAPAGKPVFNIGPLPAWRIQHGLEFARVGDGWRLARVQTLRGTLVDTEVWGGVYEGGAATKPCR